MDRNAVGQCYHTQDPVAQFRNFTPESKSAIRLLLHEDGRHENASTPFPLNIGTLPQDLILKISSCLHETPEQAWSEIFAGLRSLSNLCAATLLFESGYYPKII